MPAPPPHHALPPFWRAPLRSFISLVHVNTQIALYTGETSHPNKYGGEFEVSAYGDESSIKGTFGKRNGKVLGVGNHWALTTAEAAPAPASA